MQAQSPAIQKLMVGARKLIFDIYPETVEVPWVTQKTIGFGIGPKKMSEHFCWIGCYKNHIVLGFNYGSLLTDSGKILEGTGKLFRHYKIKEANQLKNASLKDLISEAVEMVIEKNR
ncbi:MAG TPA: DUF1801 domain-containing protein [Chryseosolibacter sp.]